MIEQPTESKIGCGPPWTRTTYLRRRSVYALFGREWAGMRCAGVLSGLGSRTWSERGSRSIGPFVLGDRPRLSRCLSCCDVTKRQRSHRLQRRIVSKQVMHVEDSGGTRRVGIVYAVAHYPRVVLRGDDLSCRLLSVGYSHLHDDAELRRKSAISKRECEMLEHLARIARRWLLTQPAVSGPF
jgi:hypothetical protein